MIDLIFIALGIVFALTAFVAVLIMGFREIRKAWNPEDKLVSLSIIFGFISIDALVLFTIISAVIVVLAYI